jgi:hypothetical protein
MNGFRETARETFARQDHDPVGRAVHAGRSVGVGEDEVTTKMATAESNALAPPRPTRHSTTRSSVPGWSAPT